MYYIMLSVDAVDTGSDRFPPPFQCQCAPGHKAVGEMGTPHSGKSKDHYPPQFVSF